MGYLSLADVCKLLSISPATGRNWLKLGKLVPEYTEPGNAYFTQEYVDLLRAELESGTNTALKSRRNKRFISGNALYKSYVSESSANIALLQQILEYITAESIEISITRIQYLVADCALHLFAQKFSQSPPVQGSLFSQYLRQSFQLEAYSELIDDLITDETDALLFSDAHPDLFCSDYTYTECEDLLGLIYISCKNIGHRKSSGSYYTPTSVVKRLIDQLSYDTEGNILDPCCGTGNFLLQLPDHVSFDRIYGTEIDPVSAKIARINMALKFDHIPVEDIVNHIRIQDYLTYSTEQHFQYIIGNPPWGYKYTDTEKTELRKSFRSAAGKQIESYDIFVEKSLRHLKPEGILSFVLPEAILHVRSHKPIRELLYENTVFKYIEYLGDIFHGVQCPSVILQFSCSKKSFTTIGMKVCIDGREFTIETEREININHLNFTTTDSEYRILHKLKHLDSAKYLAGNATFALGIVTGDNKRLITTKPNEDMEVILKGTDLRKYRVISGSHYTLYEPEKFQQVAPTSIYRADEKLLYRFISNQLVFAYDNQQRLTLNSCNIVVPHIDGLSIKYILAILNSRTAQFLYKMEHHSVKVLRSHLEQIPIPQADVSIQHVIVSYVDSLINGASTEETAAIYDKIDQLIAELYHLTESEYLEIRKSLTNNNLFLY